VLAGMLISPRGNGLRLVLRFRSSHLSRLLRCERQTAGYSQIGDSRAAFDPKFLIESATRDPGTGSAASGARLP